MADALSKDALATVVDTSEDAVILIDLKRTIRFANAAAVGFGKRCGIETLVGTSYDDLLKKSVILDEQGEQVAPESYPSAIALRDDTIVQGRTFQQIVNNTYTWMKVSSIPLHGATGKIDALIIRFMDISAQKAVEDKLRFLIQTSKILSLTSDMEERLAQKARLTVPLLADWCTVHVVRENGELPQVAVVHRNPAKEAQVRELAELSVQSEDTDIVRRVAETGTAVFYPDMTDEFLQRASGSSKWIALARELGITSSMVVPIISRGVVLGVLSLAYADSKRRYTDEDFAFMQEYCNHISLLLENAHLYEEIQKHDASKDAFLAALSHELRNPLAPIKSMLELMKLQPHASEFRHNIAVIEHQFDHLTKILTDLLEVNRYSQGKIHAELRRVNLLTVVRNSVDSAEPFLRKKHIELTVEAPSQAVVIRADPTRLEQALMNLFHNAEKFTPEGGTVSLKVTANDTRATLAIRDSGKGMEPEMLEHLFDPWIRDEKVPHTTEGLGLGLMLVKKIVELHDGTISATSEGEGKGTEFTISLPILQQHLL